MFFKSRNKFFTLLSTQKRNVRHSFNDSCGNNLTNIVIPDFVKRTLSYGDKYNAPYSSNNKIPVTEFIKEFECNILKIDSNIRNDIRTDFTNEIMRFYKQKSHLPIEDRSILYDFHNTNKFLKANPDLFVTKADKGVSVVIMFKSDYNVGMNEILKDDETYREINGNPLRKKPQINVMIS